MIKIHSVARTAFHTNAQVMYQTSSAGSRSWQGFAVPVKRIYVVNSISVLDMFCALHQLDKVFTYDWPLSLNKLRWLPEFLGESSAAENMSIGMTWEENANGD